MKIIQLLSYIITLLLTAPAMAQQIHFVNDNALGNNNGTSWQNAYTDLQQAISEAIYGDQIWVAEGSYYPTSTTDKTISFPLKNGVQLYGGFQGTENNLAQRDFTSYKSILSGDIGVATDSTDNSYHVLYCIGADSTTRLDGFTITCGQAITDTSTSVSKFNSGGGLFIATNENNPLSTPTIYNNVFTKNGAKFSGGAIHCDGTDDWIVAPDIKHCFFQHNTSLQYGSAFFKIGAAPPGESFILDSCAFEYNTGFISGGVTLWQTSGNHELKNCTFYKDFAIIGGNSVSYFSYAKATNLYIRNCSFYKLPSEDNNGSNLLFFGINNSSSSKDYKLEITDCTFEGEEVTTYNHNSLLLVGGGVFSNNDTFSCNILGCIFKNNLSGISGLIGLTTGVNMIANAEINNCRFSGFSPDSIPYKNCTAINLHQYSPITSQTNLNVNNCIFDKINTAVALSNNINGANVNANITNCVFYNTSGKKLFRRVWSPTLDYIQEVNVSNCIIWPSTEANVQGLFYNHSGSQDTTITMEGYNIDHCLLRTTDCFVNGIDECGEGMLFNIDPVFVDSMSGDFRLQTCSPAINVGNNMSVDVLSTDYIGQPRILEDIVDLGPFEQYSGPFPFLTVAVSSSSNIPDGEITIDSVTGGIPPYSYQWSTGSTDTFITALYSGAYSVTITDSTGCETIETIDVGVLSKVNTLFKDDNSLLVYPNPNKGVFHLQFDLESKGPIEILLFNSIGERVYHNESTENSTIDISHLPNGTYQVIVSQRDKRYAKKIVLQHPYPK